MKIISIMTHAPSNVPPSQDEMERMGALVGEMKNKGVLIETGGRMPQMLQLTVARKNGATTVTDGPFAEAKEVVGGFALMEVADRADALAWTNRFLELIGDATCHIHEVDMA